MNEPPNLEPSAMDALLSEADPAVAPRLADLFEAMRTEYASVPPTAGPELSALMRVGRSTRESARIRRRFEQKRASMLAKIGGAVAVLVAATGGLAAAQALPGPLQDAISHLGLPAPTKPTFDPHSSPDSTTTSDPTSASSTIAPTPTTTGTSSGHGAVVSGVARDHSTSGCEHGAAVSAAASDGRAQPGASNPSTGTSKDGSCDSTTTTVAGASPTTTDRGRGHDDSAPPTSTPQHGGGNPIEGHGGGTNHGNAGS
jgi:hypothetical protein